MIRSYIISSMYLIWLIVKPCLTYNAPKSIVFTLTVIIIFLNLHFQYFSIARKIKLLSSDHLIEISFIQIYVKLSIQLTLLLIDVVSSYVGDDGILTITNIALDFMAEYEWDTLRRSIVLRAILPIATSESFIHSHNS